jgi:hypothetical protein
MIAIRVLRQSRLGCPWIKSHRSINQSINQSINRSITGTIAPRWLNASGVGWSVVQPAQHHPWNHFSDARRFKVVAIAAHMKNHNHHNQYPTTIDASPRHDGNDPRAMAMGRLGWDRRLAQFG